MMHNKRHAGASMLFIRLLHQLKKIQLLTKQSIARHSREGAQLGQTNAAVIAQEQSAGEIIISSITAWEIAMLVQKNRLILTMDVEAGLNTVADIENVRFCPVDNEITIKSTTLPGEFHKDPADRMIVALARKLGCRLITADEKIRNYPHVHTVWKND